MEVHFNFFNIKKELRAIESECEMEEEEERAQEEETETVRFKRIQFTAHNGVKMVRV
jgi:hypothetical protein